MMRSCSDGSLLDRQNRLCSKKSKSDVCQKKSKSDVCQKKSKSGNKKVKLRLKKT